jgi:tetratricopeptide repeat protein
VGEAVELGERVLADCQRILGSEHLETLRASIVLGLSYQGAGRFGEAVKLGERVLADCQRVLNPEHPLTLRSRANLTDFHRGGGS